MSQSQIAFDRFFSQIHFPQLRQVALHWNDARRAKLMPAWRDIDPLAIYKHLPLIWSWRYDAVTERFTGKLCGEAITDAFGRSLRGVKMEEFFLEDGYPTVYVRHRRVISEPCLSRDSGAVLRHVDRLGMGERIVLPLADDGEIGDTVFGATIYDAAQLARGLHWNAEFDDLEYYPLT